MTEEKLSHEPDNPEHSYIYKGPETIDGVRGKAQIKKWTHEGKYYQRIMNFTPDTESQGSDGTTFEQQREMDKAFLERGFTASSTPLISEKNIK